MLIPLTAPDLPTGSSGALAAYLEEVRQRSGSERTPADYRAHLARFLGLVGNPQHATPAAVHAFAYAPGPSGREPSPSTVSVRLAAVGGFLGFLVRMGALPSNPAAQVRRPKQRRAIPRGLSTVDLRRLLRAIGDSPAGIRDRAIIVTALLTGLRRSELLGMRAGDLVAGDMGLLYRVRVKGGYVRHRELPRPAYDVIQGALRARGLALEGMAPSDPVFDVSPRGFAANLARYGRRLGMEALSPHVLRHSAAKLRRAGGASLEDVSAMLGHANLSTTARYLARLEGERDDGWRAVADALGLLDA